MTKAEMDAIRVRCEAATPGPWSVEECGRFCDHDECYVEITGVTSIELCDYGDARFIAHARQDVPALLDALKEAEEQIAGHCEAAYKLGRLHADMIVDRDHWKTRAEALERAINAMAEDEDSYGSLLYAVRCDTCAIRKGCAMDDDPTAPCRRWVFDEAKFAPTTHEETE